MAEASAIAWTKSTFNPWIGCTKVGPGCDHCYAEALDKRHKWKGATHWGPGVQRMRTSPSNWNGPLKWERAAAASGERWLVFCASLADVFDNEVPDEWRADLWRLIRATPHLTWQLVTKRIGNVMKMCDLYDMENVWIGATIVNQEEATRDVPKLLTVPAAVRFVSYEPALGPVDWCEALGIWLNSTTKRWVSEGPRVDWIIIGGESTQGAQARPFDLDWARSTIALCRLAGVPVFVKQLGSWPVTGSPNDCYLVERGGQDARMKDRAGADPAEWPDELRVREFPDTRVTATSGD